MSAKYINNWVCRLTFFLLLLTISCLASCQNNTNPVAGRNSSEKSIVDVSSSAADPYENIVSLLVIPKHPVQGKQLRIVAAGGSQIAKSKIIVTGPSGELKSVNTRDGNDLPCWKLNDYNPGTPGKYTVKLIVDKKVVSNSDFIVIPEKSASNDKPEWKAGKGWDTEYEALYSAWINCLFQNCGEDASWSALHEVLRDRDKNFLHNYLSLNEDDPSGSNNLIMQPDCADNPFFLRAYFAWKMELPFGYHICDRGYLGKNPKAGEWITNQNISFGNKPVQTINNFLRRVMNDIHSGTARTSLNDDNSDYYPVSLDRKSLHPGIVFADPYGHTFVLVSWVPQTSQHPGLLLAVDAQPDGTVAVKRFWEGNFLFNTSGVIGEPGFKAFRPIILKDGVMKLLKNSELIVSRGFVPFSLQQKNMKTDEFYRIMARLINPKPLDAETALLNQIEALHEQLLVRVNSVSNGEKYLKEHPGQIIPMPSSATGIFQAGGQWEDFSTPNRDLRLLIAMDAVINFPDQILRSPGDYDISGSGSPEAARKKLQEILDKKSSELTISYKRSDGSMQRLSLGEILKRKDSFEMTYNPNDGIEIRWGAPEGSEERSTCHRSAPQSQKETMKAVRKWFHSRLHPPT